MQATEYEKYEIERIFQKEYLKQQIVEISRKYMKKNTTEKIYPRDIWDRWNTYKYIYQAIFTDSARKNIQLIPYIPSIPYLNLKIK